MQTLVFSITIIGLLMGITSNVMFFFRTKSKPLQHFWLEKDILTLPEYILNRVGFVLSAGGIIVLFLQRFAPSVITPLLFFTNISLLCIIVSLLTKRFQYPNLSLTTIILLATAGLITSEIVIFFLETTWLWWWYAEVLDLLFLPWKIIALPWEWWDELGDLWAWFWMVGIVNLFFTLAITCIYILVDWQKIPRIRSLVSTF